MKTATNVARKSATGILTHTPKAPLFSQLSMIGATCVTSFGFIIGEFFPHLVASIFTTDQQLINLAAEGMRFVVFCFPIIGFQMVTTNFFQSIGKAKISIFLSLSRQLVYLLPGLLIFPGWYGLNGIWISMPVADGLAFITAIIILTVYTRKIKNTVS